MKEIYVTASIELLNSGIEPDTVFSNLKNVMEIRGHSTLIPGVLAGLLAAYEQAEKNQTPMVIVAEAKAADTKDVTTALTALGVVTTAREVVVDATLIGGAQIVFNHKLIDQSFKTQLHTLYKAALNA